jgi:PAS domain S-box-containing protein
MKEANQIEDGKALARFSQRSAMLIRLILIVIVLIGIGVIVGWHLHLRFMVQILPGVIPMQYNTALCFIVMGLSALLLLRRQGPQILPALGGAFLIVMGALVIYEYSSGKALGIDTAFFYPWERTLSADPGRMSLTSAVSFVSSGIALVLLSTRRSFLAAFALLQTLPLSLGLTSCLGYVAGVSFVLPFQLGSQMAIHTAASFLVYGGAMLVYAWKEAPPTDAGIPKWAPAVGILMMPILFVGIGITAQRRSVLAWAIPFFIGIVAAAFFAAAAYKLTHSRIKQKGLILVSVPLIFLLIFVVSVTHMTRSSEQAQAKYLRSQEVIAQAEGLLTDLADAEASMRGYVLTADAAFAEAYQKVEPRVPEHIAQLMALVKDNPQQQAKAAEMGAKASEKMIFVRRVVQVVRSGSREVAVEKVKAGEGLRIMNEFRLLREDFLKEEQRLNNERRKAVQNSWQRFNWLLVAGSAIDLFLALILAVLFSGGISRRIVALTENVKALAADQPLSAPMKGTDEIAQLDHGFREMAEALREAARKERAIFENALDIICSTDGEGTFLKMSPSSLKIWGYRPEEMIGRHFTDFLVPEEIERSVEASQEVRSKKTLTNFENRYRCKYGSIVNMLWTAWWSDADQVVFAMARDITERKRSESALRESEERYRLLFEGNPQPVWVYDIQTFKFLAVNQAAINRYGYSREEFLAMTIKDIRPAEDVPALLNNLSGLSSAEPNTWRHLKKEGSIIDVEIVSHQLIFAGRKAEIVLANDVTLRLRADQALRESEERFRMMVAGVKDYAILMLDAKGHVVNWNAGAARLKGYRAEEIIGKHFSIFYPKQDIESGKPEMALAVAARDGHFEDEGGWRLRKDGSQFWANVVLTALRDQSGVLHGFTKITRDISERKRADDKITQINKELLERSDQLESANKELEAFSYSVSHDLRAPLRAIDGFSRILLEDYSEKLDEDGNRLLEVVRQNAQNMGQLIDDLLAFSRLGRKAVELSPIDMTELAKGALEDLKGSDSGSRPAVKIANIPPAQGDRVLIRQVFINLLSNATKYSRLKEQPVVEIGGTTKNGSNIYYVKDNGAGFDMKYANKLFGVFQRLHGPEEFEGTGVGLAIVQRIIHRHGGKVWAEGKVNEGATFYFTLPRKDDSNGNFAKHE